MRSLILCASALARSGFSGKVIHIADGDTITILAPGNQQVKVRLYGIDCPERKQAFGNAAAKLAIRNFEKGVCPELYQRTSILGGSKLESWQVP